jgi:RNA polymerase sigma-70 factor (ECF subfamily)
VNKIETQMGGSHERFPTTHWSMVLGCHSEEEEDKKEKSLKRLIETYWRPVYRYIRFQGLSIEHAKDMTQDFLCHFIEKELANRYDKDRGRFRAFLKGAVKIYLARERSKKALLKRGGDRQILSLDVEKVESDPSGSSDIQSPEEAFDRQWVNDVLTQSVQAVETEFVSKGKQDYYQVYQAHRLQQEGSSKVTYDQLAEQFGITPHQVKHYLTVVRDRIHKQIRKTVSDGVTSESELAAEMSELFDL